MRPRFALLMSALAALAVVAVPAISGAAPHRNHGLTIAAAPNPINAGDGVLIYGQLNAPPVANQTIVLYHRLAGSRHGFSRIGQTTTDAHGFYEFTRAENVVLTNRSWFVREAGAAKVHSRTVHEWVHALVGINQPSTLSTDTSTPVTFTGHVTPDHAGERVRLQQQNPTTDEWKTIQTGFLDSSSNYSLTHRWRVPGSHDVRVVFPGDVRNIRGESDDVTVTIQQAEVPDFTINTSSPIIPAGSSATISGNLYMANTTTPDPSVSVTLWARQVGQQRFRALNSTPTGTDGSYSFTVMPTVDTYYQVRTTFAPHRSTAVLFEGVRDVVMMHASSSSSTVGGTVSFTGSVNPDKAHRWIYLERLGQDNEWHPVEAVRVRADSTFRFLWRFSKAGNPEFRARIHSDPRNIGGVSPPVTIMVSGNSSPSSLPPGS